MADKFHGQIKAGKTSVSIPVKLINSSTFVEVTGKIFSDVTVYYWRLGGSPTSVTTATLAAITTAWTSGGFKEADATHHPGVYRLDVPDAAFASGAEWVVITVTCTGCIAHDTCLPIEGAGSAELATLIAAPEGAALPSVTA